MSLAMRLQNLRTAKRQSLQTVADAIGASKAHIWELEKGTAKNPSIELVRKLADHFEVSIASLVGEKPDEDSDDEHLLVMYRDLKSLLRYRPDRRFCIPFIMSPRTKRSW